MKHLNLCIGTQLSKHEENKFYDARAVAKVSQGDPTPDHGIGFAWDTGDIHRQGYPPQGMHVESDTQVLTIKEIMGLIAHIRIQSSPSWST